VIDLVVKGGQIVRPDGIFPAGLGVDEGRIVIVGAEKHLPPAREVIEADGLFVLPGLIDPHVHLRDPGHTEREDWTTGSMAAALGGVTTVLDHPNTVPPVNSVANLRDKIAIAGARSVVDFGLYGGAGETSLGEITPLAEAGVVAFKTFLFPYMDRLDEFEGIFTTDDGALLDIFAAVASTGLLSCIHAENYQIVAAATRKLQAQGRTSPADHAPSHPLLAEEETTARAIRLARATGVRLHILHVSAGSVAGLIAHARAGGNVQVTAETCPQYLLLNEEQAAAAGPYGAVSPPIRPEAERELLWTHLLAGNIDTLGTDHAPHLAAAKERGWENIFAAPSGAPGLETGLPLLLTEVHRGRLNLPTLVRLTSENVARLYGLYPRKGVIRVGSDADLTLVDPVLRRTIDRSKMITKARDTARLFDGRETVGAPVMTLVRGRVVMRRGEITVEPGYGHFVPGPKPKKR
jgi:allantoinase